MKLGIFGGTFNPIHYGHLRAAEEVREKLDLDKIVFVPSGNPPLKDTELADARHRYKMVRLATFKDRSFTISDIEYRKKNKSYSVNTLKELHRLYPEASFHFIVGIDAFLDMPGWWQPEKLIGLTDFIVISRLPFKFADLSVSPYLDTGKDILKKLDSAKIESYETDIKNGRRLDSTSGRITMLNITPVGISATLIRKLLKQGKGIKYLLPEEVESYIISNKLYTS